MNGNVIGVVSFQAVKGQNLNFPVSGKGIADLKQNETLKTLSEWACDINKEPPDWPKNCAKKDLTFPSEGNLKTPSKPMIRPSGWIRILPRPIIIWGLSASSKAIRQGPWKNIKF